MRDSKFRFSLISHLRACARLLIFAAWCVVNPVYFFLAKWLGYSRFEEIPMRFHRGCRRILPLHLETEGQCITDRPTLFVCNHVSYLDIFLLGGIVPGCFIAKSEVAGWPILGQMAKLQNTLFFERNGKHARSQIDVMVQQLRQKGNLILFPEGTSTPGTYVAPFKSSLFHAAEIAEDVAIQPITLAFVSLDNHVMSPEERDFFAWYADMPFASHFYKMAGMRPMQAKIIFHKPVRLKDFSSRKACAEHCHSLISGALTQALTAPIALSDATCSAGEIDRPGA